MKKNKIIGIILIVIYISTLIIFNILFRGPVHNYYADENYLSKLFSNINMIPFIYHSNTPMLTIIKNIMIKVVLFMPVSIIVFLIDKNISYKKLSLIICGLGIYYEMFQWLSLNGYFDIMDIILYCFGSLITLKIISLLKIDF